MHERVKGGRVSGTSIFAEDPVSVSRTARAAYQRYRNGERIGSLRTSIRQSWRRSAAAGVNPDGQEPPRLHGLAAVKELREQHPLAPYVTMIGGFLEYVLQDESQVFVITDGSGEILWRFGSPRSLSIADSSGFQEGAGWSESDVGTNAIGISIETRVPNAVFSAEHFVETQHEWVCMAAPIQDPETDTLLAVMNLSGPFMRSNGEAMSFVQCAASLIREKLRFERRELDEAACREIDRMGISLGGRALISPGGRFVHGDTTVAQLVAAGRRIDDCTFEMADGQLLTGDLHGDYLLIRPPRGRTVTSSSVDLRFLGPHEPSLVVNGVRKAVTARRAEMLYLLARNSRGLSADELAMRIYGDEGNAGSARSEMHRVRHQVGGLVESHPYRFSSHATVDGDFLRVRDSLAKGSIEDALNAYTGPLLPRATSIEIEVDREELHFALRKVVLESRNPNLLRSWIESDFGSSDEEAIRCLLPHVDSQAPEAALLLARIESLRRAFGPA